MTDKITSDDWSQWATSPVTKKYIETLAQTSNEAIEHMLNQEPDHFASLELYGAAMMATRYLINGIGQATDLDHMKDLLVSASSEGVSAYEG